jgi:hypothetical protein
MAQQQLPAPFAAMSPSSVATDSTAWPGPPAGHRQSVSADVTAIFTAAPRAHTPTGSTEKQNLPLPLPNSSVETVQQPGIVFSYEVIESRSPTFVVKGCATNFRLKKMNLSQFKQALPLQLPTEAKGWLFRVIGPGIEGQCGVHRGREDEYKQVIVFLDGILRQVIPKDLGHSRLYFVIQLEALMDDNYNLKSVEEYEGELDF